MTTLVIRVDPDNPDPKAIARTARILKKGGLVAFPTETVYGLGANSLDRRAMAALRRVKKRPAGKPFTVHIADGRVIKKMGCRLEKGAAALTKKFWPGPLTIVIKSRAGKRIGFRMPANTIALRLIKASGVPVACPSANISGDAPPVSAEEVLKNLRGKIDVILDGGRTEVGVESTVLDLSGPEPVVLREGAISKEKILTACQK